MTVEPDMILPAGKTCGDCVHLSRCKMLFGCKDASRTCDFSPSRFQERTMPAPEKPAPEAVMTVYEVTVHLLLAFLMSKFDQTAFEKDLIRRQVAAAREAHVAYVGEESMLYDAALEKLCPKSSSGMPGAANASGL